MKWETRVFCDVEAYVSCQGYDGILIKSTESREFKVAPRIMIYSSLTGRGISVKDVFAFKGGRKNVDAQTMAILGDYGIERTQPKPFF
jgi:hypothetical protein